MTKVQKVRIPGPGGLELGGQLDLPASAAGAPRAWAVVTHCFTCGKDFKAVRYIGRTLAERGLGVLRLDFAGVGESEGELAATTLGGNVEDLLAACAWLAGERRAPGLLVGHSLGASAVLLAAARVPSCRAVATIAAASDHATLRGLREGAPDPEAPEVEVAIAGRQVRLRRSFWQDLERHDVTQAVRGLGRALLLLHSPQDRVVDVEHAARLFRAARHPKSFVSLDGMDHLLLEREDARYVGEVIAAWSSRHVLQPGP